MAIFTSKDNLRSGVPLGGIGAGKMELLPNGLLNAFTIQNNWSKPITGTPDYPGILGFHWGIYAESARGRKSAAVKRAVLLQTVPLQDIPVVKRIRYEGVFPRARLIFEEPGLGLDVRLEAFSPWLPFDVKHSSLPAGFFTLRVKNSLDVPVNASFLFMGRNVCGKWCVGRRNKVFERGGAVHLEFSNDDPSSRDVRQGALAFSFVKKGWEMSFMESWNAVVKNFSFNARDVRLAAWDFFKEGGRLPNINSHAVVQGENQELCGAVAARRLLPPDGEAELRFTASWYFPKHPLGHRYERWFKSVAQVSAYAAARRKRIERKMKKVERAVFALPFPGWFKDSLLANLAPFFSASWYVKDGRFSFYEAPVVCPLMGTLDVGFYGSIPLSYFFPELELSLISQFAEAQRADGYIPHDLGKNRLDMPSNGTTFFLWKDLNPKFILMVWRDYLWSGDRAFLERLYPRVKMALDWTLRTDLDGNGLPDNEGADQTFDLWSFYGTSAYTSGIFLAALLACGKMAGLMGDRSFGRQCEEFFAKGRRSFERELWNGSYFGEPCALSQLNGQWYADLLGLGPIADPAKIRRALRSIRRLTGRHSRFGRVNSVCSDGRLDRSNDHSKNIWSGMNYAFAGLCLSQGFPLANSLEAARRIWENVTRFQKDPWNQPDTIDSRTGRYVFGDSYYRNMAIWAIPIAYAMRDKKTARILESLRGC